jgi:hypothetical protein
MPSKVSERIDKPRLILVEGSDDKAFVEALIVQLDLTSVIQVMDYGGKDRLPLYLSDVLPNLPGYDHVEALGITRDADDDAPSAFDSLKSALKKAKLPVPSQVMIVAGGRPAVVVMILPGTTPGRMLEDVCFAAFESDPAIPCVDGYFACLKQQGITLDPGSYAKVRLRLLLFSKIEGELRLMDAVRKPWWPWTHSAFDEVR